MGRGRQASSAALADWESPTGLGSSQTERPPEGEVCSLGGQEWSGPGRGRGSLSHEGALCPPSSPTQGFTESLCEHRGQVTSDSHLAWVLQLGSMMPGRGPNVAFPSASVAGGVVARGVGGGCHRWRMGGARPIPLLLAPPHAHVSPEHAEGPPEPASFPPPRSSGLHPGSSGPLLRASGS